MRTGALGAAALLLSAACTRAPERGDQPRASASRAEPQPDIVFFLLDTLRADHVPAYGYPKRTMPFLSRLAERGVVFERAWAPSSWTPTSMASIFTGLWANQHGVLTGFRATQRALREGDTIELNRVPAAAELLPEVLKRAGYRTYGAADNINMGPAMGLTRGFDRFFGRPDGGVRGRVRGWKQELRPGGGPFFLYLHYMDAHGPFKTSPRSGQTEIDATIEAYDAALGSLDEKIRYTFGTLGLEKRENLVVLLLADHGEEFLEHGGTGHGIKLYEELLRVPLILYAPGRLEPRRVAQPVSTIDVLPTLRELAGVPRGQQDAGVSLLATLRGEVKETRSFFPMRFWKPSNVRLARKAVVHGRHKYIVEQPVNTEELYDLEADPGERRNLAASEPALVAELRERLRSFERSAPSYPREFASKVPITRDQAEELKALGYVQ
ncbi:MAG TPA: sulfatase [Vicinamibacteria bacterium]|nr:sulfatase [Vicinamibacteria bacterium]